MKDIPEVHIVGQQEHLECGCSSCRGCSNGLHQEQQQQKKGWWLSTHRDVRVLLRERLPAFARRLPRGDWLTSGVESALGGCKVEALSELSVATSSEAQGA